MTNLEKEVENIKKQLLTLILNMSNDKKYIGYDMEAGRENTSRAQRSADKNTEDISKAEENQIRAEQEITELDLQNIVAEQSITDLDIRLMELEG